MTYDDLKKDLLAQSPQAQKEYDDLGPQYKIIQAVISARAKKGLTQSQLADLIGTKQSSISRFESGNYNPSLSFLQKIADVLGLELVVTLKEEKAS